MFPQSPQSWDVQKTTPTPLPPSPGLHPTAGQEKMNFHHEQTHTGDNPKGRIEATIKTVTAFDPHDFWKVQTPFPLLKSSYWPRYTGYKHYLHSCIWNVQV